LTTTRKKTAFNYIDELSFEEQATLFKQAKAHWDSLSVEERTRHMAIYYEAIREKSNNLVGLKPCSVAFQLPRRHGAHMDPYFVSIEEAITPHFTH
jgi:hypothetical protein